MFPVEDQKIPTKKKILIVEDDKFLLNAYRVKFTKLGFDIELAGDGQEALDKVPVFHPDLMLLDLIMPVKDGFSVLTELKANDATKSIPVIITSNLSQKQDIDKALSLGAKDFIVKSEISMDDLVKKIQSTLSA